MRNASPIELAWSAVAVVGVLLSLWMIADAWLDLQVVRRAILGGYARSRGARWWIAVGALVGNVLTAFVWLGFLLVGLIAMQHPAATPVAERPQINVAAGWVLLAMEALLAAIQVWSRIVREYVVGRPHIPMAPRAQP